MFRGYKICIALFVGLYFGLVFFDNLIDFDINWQYAQDILSMQNVQDTSLHWRAITSPVMQKGIYIGTIIWQGLNALLALIGAFCMLFAVRKTASSFKKAAYAAQLGLFLGFSYFFLVYVVLASEWFYIWQATSETEQVKSLLYSILFLLACFVVAHKENAS